MNQIKLDVPFVDFKADDVNSVASTVETLSFNKIDQFPWGPPAEKPIVNFKIAHNNHFILLHYNVMESEILARYTKHNDPVYTDSCVEFFISFDGDDNYYNFEMNPLGTILSACGPDRNKRESQPETLIDTIKTQTKLTRNGSKHFNWELTALIPQEAFMYRNMNSLSGLKATANFYKCGDDLKNPHYISWGNIQTPNPDFHQPPFFGEINFL